ncbi:ABC transporter substrate-binding protein [Paenibacillus naphthalenovorans]|uniref:ABC transporter substrate-binding protein n=1 Tax=Paenibacillus naphthalenovorans TaxID=162209 RepID=UPI0008834B00|nr:ABC transporter substrate-binding protein [Paenibacillus naphthalenovorans]SDJ67489.1 multiple sugar transport system substrate-binding protein [Paenibacillus naphthalenovorans]
MTGWRRSVRRNGHILLLMALPLVFAAACQSKDAPEPQPVPKEPVTITFSSLETGTGTAQKMAEAFMNQRPDIRVKTVILPPISDVMHNEYVNQLVSGSTDTDLFALDVIWIEEFASAGWLAPLDEYFPANELKGMLPKPLEGVYSRGRMYALPWYADTGLLFYRKDLLESLDRRPPATWDDLIAQAEMLKRTGLVEHGYVFQANAYEGLTVNFLESVWNNGGRLGERSDRPQLYSRESVEALQYMQRLIREGIAPKEVLDFKEGDSRDWFLDGRAAFLRSGPIVWGLSNREDSKVKGRIGIAPLPVGPHGTTGGSSIGGSSLGMNARISESRKAAAVAFLKFLIGEEAQKQIALEHSRIPVMKRTFEDPEVLAFNPFYRDIPAVLANSHFRPKAAHYADISSVLQIGLHDALSQGSPADKVLQAVDRIVGELPSVAEPASGLNRP